MPQWLSMVLLLLEHDPTTHGHQCLSLLVTRSQRWLTFSGPLCEGQLTCSTRMSMSRDVSMGGSARIDLELFLVRSFLKNKEECGKEKRSLACCSNLHGIGAAALQDSSRYRLWHTAALLPPPSMTRPNSSPAPASLCLIF